MCKGKLKVVDVMEEGGSLGRRTSLQRKQYVGLGAWYAGDGKADMAAFLDGRWRSG